ncbi:MAG: acyl--CoA ligase [Spirochaetales bacterium]|nr:acyl--CoA ligase [Spirochaetales bacterium]
MKRDLRTWGIVKGSPVPLFLHNSIDFVVAFLALMDLGAIPVLANMDFRRLELAEIFADVRPPAVLAEKNHLGYLQSHLGGCTVISHDGGEFKVIGHRENAGHDGEIDEEIASINYTYRGCGYPLGALIPPGQYIQGAAGFHRCLQSDPGDRILAILPMHHIYTLVSAIFFPLLNRLTSIVCRTIHPGYIFEYVDTYRIKYVTTVPEIFAMLYRLFDAGARLPAEVFVSGGSVLTAEAYHRIRERFDVELLNGYGLTEYTPATGNIRGSARAGTIGEPCPGIDIRLHEANAEGIGEMWLHGRDMCRGYLRRPGETADLYCGEWLKTGDLARKQGDHYIFVGEKKKTRKVNGNMVDLEEVKRALLLLPRVQSAEVTGETNSIRARIELNRPSRDAEEDRRAARALLQEAIAGYKIPATIEII